MEHSAPKHTAPNDATNRAWLSLLRCLTIVQRLMQGPASAEALFAAVRQHVGADAYPEAPLARSKAFKRDRERLRRTLRVTLCYDTSQRQYRLDDPGPFLALSLSESGMHGLEVLLHTFSGDLRKGTGVDALINDLLRRARPELLRRLEKPSARVELRVGQHVELQAIAAATWEAVQKALREQRELEFDYRSPRFEENQPRHYVVAPGRLFYRNGHWYLLAHVRHSKTGAEGRWRQFRLSYIQPATARALASRFAPLAIPRPTYEVHYRLFGPLARGLVSHHFADMQITPLEDCVEVRGLTDNAWEAARLLLGYGQHCQVLGGEEVLHHFLNEVQGLIARYTPVRSLV